MSKNHERNGWEGPSLLPAQSCVLCAREASYKGDSFYFYTRILERRKGNTDRCTTAAGTL